VLKAYGLPVHETAVAATPAEAVRAAEQIGFPVVVKIVSDDIIHKTDVGGVVLDLQTPEAVAGACEAMLGRMKKAQPDAKIKGFLVRRMIPQGEEVILGVKRDPTFGPGGHVRLRRHFRRGAERRKFRRDAGRSGRRWTG
jgi:acyl-CoA synthetase (NDP forming)